MKKLKFYRYLSLVFCFSNLVICAYSQGDSIITRNYLVYDGDSISSSTRNVEHYYDGVKHFESEANNYPNGEPGYKQTIYEYDLDNNLLRSSTLYYSWHTCPEQAVNDKLDYGFHITPFAIERPLENIEEKHCGDRGEAKTSFSDSLDITVSFVTGQELGATIDSTFYNDNHDIIRKIAYRAGKVFSEELHSYEYDGVGRTIKEKRWYPMDVRSDEWIYAYHQDQRINLSQRSIDRNGDEVQFTHFYDSNFYQTGSSTFKNGVLMNKYEFSSKIYKSGHKARQNVYFDGSGDKLKIEYGYYKFSPQREEIFRTQREDGKIKYTYWLADTIHHDNCKEFCSYSKALKSIPKNYKSPKKKSLFLSQRACYDQWDRIVRIENYDWESGDLSSVISYEYIDPSH